MFLNTEQSVCSNNREKINTNVFTVYYYLFHTAKIVFFENLFFNLQIKAYFCRYNYVKLLRIMIYNNKFAQSDDYRREELIRIIEHSVEKLTLAELEALYYDMTTKSYIND